MKLKSTFSIQDKNFRDLDNSDEYLTLADQITEQGVSCLLYTSPSPRD